jgi:hypothetical protein
MRASWDDFRVVKAIAETGSLAAASECKRLTKPEKVAIYGTIARVRYVCDKPKWSCQKYAA